MRKSKLVQPFIIGCVILLLLTGCFPSRPGAAASPPVPSTLVQGITLTPTIFPTSTGTPTPTFVPTPTITQTPMSTPLTGLLPVGASLRLSKGPVKFSDLSPDGKTLLVGSKITVCAYQVLDGKEIWCRTTDQEDLSGLRGLAYSPDGKTFLTGLENERLILWDSASGMPLWVIPDIKLNTATWSPDGKRLAVSSQELFLRILDPANGHTRSTIPLPGIPPTVLRWSPDGKTIAAGDDSGAITLWDPQTGKVLSTQHYFPNSQLVTSLAWSPDSKMVLGGSSYASCNTPDCFPTYAGKLVLFDVSSGAVKWQVDVNNQVHALTLSPDGSTVLAHVDDTVGNLYALSDGKLIQSITAYGARGAYWQPDGKGLYTIDWFDNLVSLSLSGQQLASTRLEGYYDLFDFAWSPDGSQLAASQVGGPILFWDTASGKLLRSFWINDLGPIAWSPNGKTFGTFDFDYYGGHPRVILIDPQSGNLIQTLNVIRESVDTLAWSPDGKLLAVLSHDASTDGAWLSSIIIWDTSTWKVFQVIPTDNRNHSPLHDIVWSHDGKFLLGVGGLYQWDATTGVQKSLGPGNIFSSLSLSPDGSHVVTNNGWVLDLQHLYGVFALGSTSNRGPVTSAAYSPDGKYLASGGDHIVLHNPKDGTILVTLDGFANQPDKLEFSPDGKTIASLSKADGTILLWKVP